MPVDLDEMLIGGGEDADWLALIARPDAERAWTRARERRAAVDQLAEVAVGSPWLAGYLLALNRARRRTVSPPTAPPALTVGPPEFAAVLRAGPAHRSIEVQWGERGVHHVSLGEDLRLSAPEGAEIWYATASGSGALRGRGWRVEEGDLPFLIVVAEPRGESMTEALAGATRAAGCLFVGEREIEP
jgi:hypothetical protein